MHCHLVEIERRGGPLEWKKSGIKVKFTTCSIPNAVRDLKPRPLGLVSWSRPRHPLGRGCAVWRKSTYKVYFDGIENPEISESETFSFVPDADQVFRVRVRPVTSGGEGPTSAEATSTRYLITSVTRLGDFLKLLATKLLTKVAQIIDNFFGYF